MTAPVFTHRGVFYFATRADATAHAIAHGFPLGGVKDYTLGWTCQAGPSGNYAGPASPTPRLWQGRAY